MKEYVKPASADAVYNVILTYSHYRNVLKINANKAFSQLKSSFGSHRPAFVQLLLRRSVVTVYP
jgi:hypothetical protein